MTPATGWIWHQPVIVLTAPTWGGNLEVLHWNLAAGRWIRPVEDYAGCVLLLETSEEMPTALEVFRMLRERGERGAARPVPGGSDRPRARRRISTSVRPADERQPYRDRAARRGAARVRRVPPGRDDRLRRRLRAHRPAVGAALRRPGDRRRTEPHDHRPLLSGGVTRERAAAVDERQRAQAALEVPLQVRRDQPARLAPVVGESWRRHAASRRSSSAIISCDAARAAGAPIRSGGSPRTPRRPRPR